MCFNAGLRKYALAAATIPIVAATQPTPDFRELTPAIGHTLVIDLGAMRIDGTVRRVAFNIISAKEPDSRTQSQVQLNCDRRMVKMGPVSLVGANGSTASPRDQPSKVWQRADNDTTGTRITDLICAAPDDRDRYAPKRDAPSLNAALAAARADMKSPSDRTTSDRSGKTK